MNKIRQRSLENYRILKDERRRSFQLVRNFESDELTEPEVLFEISEKFFIALMLDIKAEREDPECAKEA